MTSLLDALAPPPPNAALCAQLWATVEQAVLIGDLYASDPAAQDLALDCGWELSAWAERLEAEFELELSAPRLALAGASAKLASLAPRG